MLLIIGLVITAMFAFAISIFATIMVVSGVFTETIATAMGAPSSAKEMV